MADIELVIKISEELYEDIKYNFDKQNYGEYGGYLISSKIVFGTPLPKGHGRLIYAKDAIETLQIMFSGDEDIQNACEQCISDCPTIIEVDEGE